MDSSRIPDKVYCWRCGAENAFGAGSCSSCGTRLLVAPMPGSQLRKGTPPEASTRAIGGYTLGDKIEEGDAGEVYLARDEALGRDVVVNLVKQTISDEEDYTHKLARGAETLAHVSHPNVAQVIDFGEDAGRHYVVREYVEGTGLDRKIADGEPMGPEAVVAIARQVVVALRAAHEVGILHKNICPRNIILRPDGVAKVTNFGLAGNMVSDSQLSAAGTIPASPHYMSPEQCENRALTAAADIYSLGATLYHMLAGRPVYTGETGFDVMNHHRFERVPVVREALPRVPTALCDLMERMLAKAPRRRPQSADLLLKTLQDPAMLQPRAKQKAGRRAERERPPREKKSAVAAPAFDFAHLVEHVGEAELRELRERLSEIWSAAGEHWQMDRVMSLAREANATYGSEGAPLVKATVVETFTSRGLTLALVLGSSLGEAYRDARLVRGIQFRRSLLHSVSFTYEVEGDVRYAALGVADWDDEHVIREGTRAPRRLVTVILLPPLEYPGSPRAFIRDEVLAPDIATNSLFHFVASRAFRKRLPPRADAT